MNIRNRVGERTDPYGTPQDYLLKLYSSRVKMVFSKKSLRKFTINGFSSALTSLSIRICQSTVSKAFQKSKNISALLFSEFSLQKLYISRMLSVV